MQFKVLFGVYTPLFALYIQEGWVGSILGGYSPEAREQTQRHHLTGQQYDYSFSNVGVRFCNPDKRAAETSFVCRAAPFHTLV